MEFNHSRRENLQVGKVGLPPLTFSTHSTPEAFAGRVRFLSVNYQFGIECVRNVSGGKPTFPTCKFSRREWLLLQPKTRRAGLTQIFGN